MLCHQITSDPSTRLGICYRGLARCSAPTRTFSKLISILVTDTKSLRRGGPLCPPVPTDFRFMSVIATTGRRGSRPQRGIWRNHLTFSLSLTCILFVSDTKSLCRGGPLCPPALPDMLTVMESVPSGRRGSRPLRGNFLHALLAHYVGHVSTFRNLLPLAGTAFRLYADIFETIFHIGDGHKISV